MRRVKPFLTPGYREQAEAADAGSRESHWFLAAIRSKLANHQDADPQERMSDGLSMPHGAQALKAVETEIADYLPEFQEMIMQLQSVHIPEIPKLSSGNVADYTGCGYQIRPLPTCRNFARYSLLA